MKKQEEIEGHKLGTIDEHSKDKSQMQGFSKWNNEKEPHKHEKEMISFHTSKPNRVKWEKYVEKSGFNSISELIHEAVKVFIEYNMKLGEKSQQINMDYLSSLSHDLKEPLTSIKGFIQLVIEKYRDELNNDTIEILSNALNQSQILENKIINKLDNIELESDESQYDILLIEDDIETIKLLSSYFQTKNYTCKGVISGFKALEELKNVLPKLILMDVILPDVYGFELCETIKSDDRFSDVTIFYLTAIPSSEVEKHVKETKADGYILKPFNLSDLNFLFEYL